MMFRHKARGYNMFAMRLKLGIERNKEWRCCLCLHVRTATILFGLWHLVLHILALATLALILRNHHVAIREEIHNDFLPTPLSKVREDDNPYYLPTTQEGRSVFTTNMDMGALMTVCTLSITLLMIYGAVKGKGSHLLPFFCLQMFDFAITTLTATGYFCYLRSAHRLIAEHWNLPLRHELLQLSPQVLTLVVLIAFLFAMLWKAYWISILWRCYKYLTLRQNSTRASVHYIIPEADRVNDGDYPAFFRESESAFEGPFKLTPPPSYQDIMDDQPPPYPVIAEVVRETNPSETLPNVAVNQASTPSDETPVPTSSEVEADIEQTTNVSPATENKSENEASTSQLKETTDEKAAATEKINEVKKNFDVETKSQK